VDGRWTVRELSGVKKCTSIKVKQHQNNHVTSYDTKCSAASDFKSRNLCLIQSN